MSPHNAMGRALLVCVSISALGCADAVKSPVTYPQDLSLNLRWTRGSEDQSWDQARAGLWYSLAALGARPPADERGLVLLSETEDLVIFRLDLAEVGLPDERADAMQAALDPLQRSDEMALWGSVDLGRLLMRTLYSPWYYAAITGVCPDLDDWQAARLDLEPALYAVTDSRLVEGHRQIALNPLPATLRAFAFQANEGEGSLTDGSFVAEEFEVIDAMDNGQQRFAVYGADGVLLPGATISSAGTAGRCLWCHELHVQPVLNTDEPVDGYLSYEEMIASLDAAQTVLETARASAPSAVDWSDYRQHEWGEQIAESFLAPSSAYLATEWSVSIDEAVSIATDLGLSTHNNDEYPAWGELYQRSDLDALSAEILSALAQDPDHPFAGVVADDYQPLAVLDSARDLSESDWAALPGQELAAALPACAP